jgi:hypothetical protein
MLAGNKEGALAPYATIIVAFDLSKLVYTLE